MLNQIEAVKTFKHAHYCHQSRDLILIYLKKRVKIAEQLKLYDQGFSAKNEQKSQRDSCCCCCCNCDNLDDQEKREEKVEEVEKENVQVKVEAKDETHTTTAVEEEDAESFSSEEILESKTEKQDKVFEKENYKISYCCCGKDCHTKAFSSSLTDVREAGPTTKYDINYVKPRRPRMLTRSKSALETSRSRSRSAKSKSPSSRPPWIPTGANQYYQTHYARSNIMSGQKVAHDSSTIPIQGLSSESSLTKTCHDKSVNTSSNQAPTYYTYQTYEPAKTIVKTTIDSKSFVRTNDGPYQYYNVVCEKNLPKITQKSVNFDLKNNSTFDYVRPLSASASYSYKHAKNPYCSEVKSVNICDQNTKNNSYYTVPPSHTSKSSPGHFQPVDSTFKGKLYSKNNEIHYVSDQASRTWNSNKTPHVRIVNAGTTVIHE